MATVSTDEEAIFKIACQIASPQARADYLSQVCGDDAALFHRVATLLQAHEDAPGFLESPPPGIGVAAPTLNERPGTHIGPYKLLEQIGEGGFGVVFMAEQEHPVRRIVAIKVIKPGMDTKQIIARFDAEREALARMDHPNIAKFLDAGTTGERRQETEDRRQELGGERRQETGVRRQELGVSIQGADERFLPPVSCLLSPVSSLLTSDPGRPYFVMELVRGLPITLYCDENKLALRQRLELFVPLCQAVQHAHQKGIIHRDIKPSNVLITLHEGMPLVKVIDFGIAKATGRQLTDKTLFTGFAQMIGTPLYMSPEQATLGNADVDTRSDIYSLGVLLYELLAGSTPLEKTRLHEMGFDEILRIIREDDPPTPSTRLSRFRVPTSANAGTAPQRSPDPSLEAIAAQRQMEPAKLARLLRGDLDCIVMRALDKDRNRRYGTAANLAEDVERYLRREAILARPPSARYKLGKFIQRNRVAVLATAAVAAALLVGTLVATWQAVEATRAQADAVAASAAATKAKETAERAERSALAAAAAAKKAKETAEMREAQARSMFEFLEMQILWAARPEGQEGGLGRDVTVRQAIKAALPHLDKSFANQPFLEAMLRSTVGQSFMYLGEARLAADQLSRARVLLTKLLGPGHPQTLRSMNDLAVVLANLGQPADALKLHEETLVLQKKHIGIDHPETLRSLYNMAECHVALGRLADALKLHEEVLARRTAKLGANDPDTILSMHAVARNLAGLGRDAEALKLTEETLALMKAKLGPYHPYTLAGMNNLGKAYFAAGRYADARKLHEETLALMKIKLGPDHPATLKGMRNLARAYAAVGRHADAQGLREEVLKLREAKLGPNHPDTILSMQDLAASLMDAGRHEEALKLSEQAFKLQKASLGPDHPHTLLGMHPVAANLLALHRGAEAVPIIDECIERARTKIADPKLIPLMVELRLRHFEDAKDADGCRATAELWEKLQRTGAESLYCGACLRAVTATVLRAGNDSPIAKAQANAEADRAMAWLQQAVAAGYKDVAHLKRDKDLDDLRDREDYRKLVMKLGASK
ncbi:MAG TPA: serine/threonine-protein kinase [Gemmataceae bacterium]|jgi:serine/threonine protein kinase|nr:serine/threonine-protein kinase [Gemmataceae bacterium]